MGKPRSAADNFGRRRTLASGRAWFVASLWLTVGCNKELEQPVLPTNGGPVSNSLKAPVYQAPGKNDKVTLSERKWGTRRGSGTPSSPLTTANKAMAAAQAKSLNDHPDGLRREELQKVLDEQMGDLAKCFDNVEVTSVGIYFEADPSGTARGVRVSGAPGASEACAKNIVTALKFPEFQGNPVPIDFPIRISRTVKTVQGGAPGDQAQAPPANAFVNP